MLLILLFIYQAAGIPNPTRQVDQSAALEALRRLESRLRSTEDELSEMKLKVNKPLHYIVMSDLVWSILFVIDGRK